MILGAHVSAAGGLDKALARAIALNVQAMQIHPTGPQSWARPTTTDEAAANFAAAYPLAGIRSVVFHNVYLTNFASENQAGWHGSISISQSYLQLLDKVRGHGVITHLGSHKGAGMAAVLDRVVDGLERTLAEVPETACFVIENTAGAGGSIGRSLEEIQMITDRVLPRHDNVGICIDTCHAFASGIPIHTEEGLRAFVDEFSSRFGLDRLVAIHLNDSKNDFGSFKDRHENIGDGFLGLEAIRRIVNHPELQNIPFILEVPGIERGGPDAENLDRVRGLSIT